MSNIKVKIKGVKQITINGIYNSLAPYVQYKDDAKMADTTNAFTDYLSSSGCNPNDDKIVIKQLPDKGSLFYLTNPAAPTPVYAVVTLGQSILVKDILINKVLKFQAEGLSDNAFTGTYMTTFKFERFCGIASNNIIASVNLSMVDDFQNPVQFVETLTEQNADSCSHSLIEFEVRGDLNNYPLWLDFSGSPSGAEVMLTKLGTGTGVFIDTETNMEFFGMTQPKDGEMNLFSKIDLLLTNTGTTKFRLTIMSSDTIRLPNNQLALTSCSEIEGMQSTSTFASVALLSEDSSTSGISIINNRTVYYSAGSGGGD